MTASSFAKRVAAAKIHASPTLMPSSTVAGTIRPTIAIAAGDMHNVATKGERALIMASAPFYVRGGSIVRPILDEVKDARGLALSLARLVEVQDGAMLDHLGRAAAWEKFDGRKQAFVPTDPPAAVATTILSRDGEWTFPRLAGVITTPTLRPDGSILSAAGYDEATQLVLLNPPALPTMPDKPSREDAVQALGTLSALLTEFPFVDEASRSVALSALITPVVRGAMAVSPMHAVTATAPGSGKSYIVDIASAISTGERAPVMSAGRTEEETEKRLTSAILAGQALVPIDNVNGELGGDFLCQLVERPMVNVRPLGTSKLVKVPSRACCFATGNNIQLVGDMTRRVVLCWLDPDMERPETRQFSGNPFAAVMEYRGKYIGAALTIVRAYVVAGCPNDLPALASFEDWSRLVRSALVWLGCVDPLQTMEKARAEDPVTSALSALFSAWYQATGSKIHTTASIKGLTQQMDPFQNLLHHDLRQALNDVADDGRGNIDTRRLGRYLGSYAGRVVAGFKLVASQDPHAKQRAWQVVKAG
jgi:putative DNA primase/helicase